MSAASSDEEVAVSLAEIHDYDEDAEEGTVYTTARRTTSNNLAADMMAEYTDVNATRKTATKVRVGQLPGSVARSTPQCSVGTSGTGSNATCNTASKIAVPRYQHKQG